MKRIDITGQKFNRLFVIRRDGYQGKKIMWLCRCDCGEMNRVSTDGLRHGGVKSCGCLRKKKPHNYTHGMTDSRIYNIFYQMQRRCNNSKNKVFKYYGGRGIRCEWKDFEEFKNDMLESYNLHVKEFGEHQTTIERNDTNGNYSIKNCRWATRKEQAMNKRSNFLITFKGITKPILQWCHEMKISKLTYIKRLQRGWTVERALTTPLRITKNSPNHLFTGNTND